MSWSRLNFTAPFFTAPFFTAPFFTAPFLQLHFCFTSHMSQTTTIEPRFDFRYGFRSSLELETYGIKFTSVGMELKTIAGYFYHHAKALGHITADHTTDEILSMRHLRAFYGCILGGGLSHNYEKVMYDGKETLMSRGSAIVSAKINNPNYLSDQDLFFTDKKHLNDVMKIKGHTKVSGDELEDSYLAKTCIANWIGHHVNLLIFIFYMR